MGMHTSGVIAARDEIQLRNGSLSWSSSDLLLMVTDNDYIIDTC